MKTFQWAESIRRKMLSCAKPIEVLPLPEGDTPSHSTSGPCRAATRSPGGGLSRC